MSRSAHLIKHFRYEHLPEILAAASKPFCELAYQLCNSGLYSYDSDQLDMALEHLLIAKDAAVRAALTPEPEQTQRSLLGASTRRQMVDYSAPGDPTNTTGESLYSRSQRLMEQAAATGRAQEADNPSAGLSEPLKTMCPVQHPDYGPCARMAHSQRTVHTDRIMRAGTTEYYNLPGAHQWFDEKPTT